MAARPGTALAATPAPVWRLQANLGRRGVDALAALGHLVRIAAALGRALAHGRCDRREWLRATWRFGVGSLPVVIASAGFAGVIMVLQVTVWVRRFGAEELVGWFAGFAALRELVPILVGLMFSGRVGASHTSELATWTASARLDVLRVLGIDVQGWLLVPRALGMALCMVGLVAIGDAVALAAGALGASLLLDIEAAQFFRSLVERLAPADFLIGIAKAGAFGTLIALVSTHAGLRQRGGARGVGEAVHAQVVASALGIFALDGCLSAWLS